MISEKTKLKLLDKSTQDLVNLRTVIDNELDKRYDDEIDMAELNYDFNTIQYYIHRQPIKKGCV